MNLVQALKSLIKESAQFSIIDSQVVLIERGREATLKEISIVSLGQDAFGIKHDKISGQPCAIFSEGLDCCKACDAIIFCQLGGQKFILICEMKSTLPQSNECVAQLKSAACFLDYLHSVLSHFYDTNLTAWERKYFLFHERVTSIPKRTTWPHHRGNSIPQRFLPVQVKNKEKIYLRKLIGLN